MKVLKDVLWSKKRFDHTITIDMQINGIAYNKVASDIWLYVHEIVTRQVHDVSLQIIRSKHK